MGLLSSIFGGSSTPKRRKALKKPKQSASIKQKETYVKKRTKQLEDAVKKERLNEQIQVLSNLKPADLLKKKLR